MNSILSQFFFFLCFGFMSIYSLSAQNKDYSPLEYKVTKEYFQSQYVKDAEDQKIVDLFHDKNRQNRIWGLAAFGTTLVAGRTSIIPLGTNVTISPFTPVALTLITISITKATRYSRKKRFLYVTGKSPLPNYVQKRISEK